MSRSDRLPVVSLVDVAGGLNLFNSAVTLGTLNGMSSGLVTFVRTTF